MTGKTNYLFAACTLIMLTGSAHAYDEKYKRVDVRMGESLYLQPKDAKAGEEIKTGGTQSAQALTNPKGKDEVQKKKLVIMGYAGIYYLGHHIFYDFAPGTFPVTNKSIYMLHGVSWSPEHSPNTGGDIMFEGHPPVHFLNSPWQKIGTGNVTQRTSTVRVLSLQPGMNFFTVKLDPFDKIFEYQQAAPKNGKTQPVSRLENNNNAVFAIELVKPPKLDIQKPVLPKLSK